MRKWNKVWVLGLGVVFAALLAAQMPSTPSTIYRDPQHRFTLRVPSGWTTTVTGSDSVQFSRGNAYVSVLIMEGSGTAASLVNSLTSQIKKQWTNFQLIKMAECPFAGRQGFCSYYAGVPPNGTENYGQILAVATGQRACALVESVPMAQFASLKSSVELMERSFSPGGNPVASASPGDALWDSIAGSSQAPAKRSSVQGESLAAPASLPVVMLAHDVTYRVALPEGWRLVVQPMLEYSLVFGTQGESFAIGLEDVYLDPRMLRSILEPGYRAILPPAQFILKSRMAAPPMGPLEVVTRLLPHLAGGPQGAIQNLRVLRTFPGPEEFGFRQMLVEYQYTFLPQRDPAFASQAHPAVRAQAQVPMEAAAYIVTFPYMPGQFSWEFGYRILSAPQTVFQRNARTYAQIFQTFEVLPEGLRAKIKSNEDMAKLCDAMNKTTREVTQNWWSALGAGTEAAGSDSPPRETSPGGQPAKRDSGAASCGPAIPCPQDYYRWYCQTQRSGGCVQMCEPKGQRPVETAEHYNCKRTQW